MRIHSLALAGALAAAPLPGVADTLLDVHALGLRTARAAGVPAAPASTTFTTASVAMFDAANALEGRYRPYRATPAPPAGADAEAAVLGAGCAVLSAGFPSQASAVVSACDALAAAMPATEAVRAGRAFGDGVGKAAFAARQGEARPVPNTYRPRTAAGTYVPTPLPIGFDSAATKPWSLTSPAQFRPGPPPRLDSELWVRDFNEVKTLGGRNSTARTPEQTATALFWASNGPQQFVDSVPDLPLAGTTPAERARSLALFYMALTDASIAVFDAKNAYEFWRPITAIRNADEDNNPATDRDPGWVPLIETPLHQEYPCAHCTVTAAFVTVLAGAAGDGPLAKPIVLRPADLATATAKPRAWSRAPDAMAEVGNARVWSGVHYRNSADVGATLGRAVARQVMETQLLPVK